MRSTLVRVGLLATILGVATSASAAVAVLNGEYTITETVTPTGTPNSYQFVYNITNINQQYGPETGLDGFYIQVPVSATRITISNPPTYSPGGYWTSGLSETSNPDLSGQPAQPGYQWLWWWGGLPPSVYPSDATATFSVQMDNVALGTTSAALYTFWSGYPAPGSILAYNGAYYSEYATSLVGPVAIPERSTLVVWSLLGGIGLAVSRWRKRAAA